MLSINFGNETENHAKEHFNDLKDWVFKRKEKYVNNSTLNNFLNNNNIEIILKGNIDELFDLDAEIKRKRLYGRFKSEIENVFNYTSFRKYKKTVYNGFVLSEKLGIECCPYCNRNYTTSHQTYFKNEGGNLNEKYVFPEFDHFYPKENYPLLAISFYNLIPSCNICNTHYKNDREPNEIFHPYTKVEPNHFNFKGFPNDVETLYGAGNKITLDFDYNSTVKINNQIEKSIEFFGIKDIYEKCHSDLIKEIIHKKLAFSDSYIKILQSTYNIGFEEAYRILFEVYNEEDKLHKRPFSKFKKDIIDELNRNI